jgi:prophage regulatory protein
MSNTTQNLTPICNHLPADGFLRLRQIVGDQKAIPPIPAIVPISRSAWWAGVKSGRYPAAVKLGPRTTAWRVTDIRALIERTQVKGCA